MALNQNLQKLKTLVSLHDEAKEGKKYASKQEWVLDTLNQIISILDQGLTKEEFTTAFKALNDYVKKAKEVISESNKSEIDRLSRDLRNALDTAINESDDTRNGTLDSLKKNMDELMSSVRFSHEAMMAEAQAKIDEIQDGEDGMDADENAVAEKAAQLALPMVLKNIPPQEVDFSPVEEKIDALDKRVSNIRTAPFIGPSRGVFLYINGVKKGLVNSLDIVGSGVATSVVNGLLTITITGGAGNGVNIETPSGTVNGTNLSFTVSNEPKYIIVDGVSKFVTTHYSYSGGTITLLADNAPVQFIRSVF